MSSSEKLYVYQRLDIDEIRLLHIKTDSDDDDDVPQLINPDSTLDVREPE